MKPHQHPTQRVPNAFERVPRRASVPMAGAGVAAPQRVNLRPKKYGASTIAYSRAE